jgi:hypothetical protein
MADQTYQGIRDALKNLIVVKFELDTPERETGALRSEILTDTAEKKRIFADPEVQELLQDLIEHERPRDHQAGEEHVHPSRVSDETGYRALLWKEFEKILEEMIAEAEGLGMPEQ